MKYSRELIDKLVKEYGSPLYIFNEDEFRRNYKHFVSAMSSVYDKYHLSYSYKTNYCPYICKVVKELGGYAEVVSDMEYYFAKKLGYRDDEIIYNGPYKGELSHEMVLNGGLLNIDNLDELNIIIDLAKRNSERDINIGLRINVNIGQSFISRFGIDTDGSDLEKALNKIHEISNLHIQGLHLHVGQSRTTESWSNRAKRMIEVIDKYFKGYRLKYIDLGSGMFGEMDDYLGDQFSKNRPVYEDYAKAIGNVVNDYYRDYNYEDKPILFTEPGTTIINHYIDFVGSVFSIKHIKGQDIVVMDCSKHNLGEICTLKSLPVEVIRNGEGNEVNNANIVGYTCLEHDVMYRGLSGNIGVGDYILFGNVGGYSNVDKPPFILPNCAMVSVKEGEARLIKRRETYEDILATYVI